MRRLSSRALIGVIIAVAIVTVSAGVAVSQQASPTQRDFAPVAGQWTGFVEGIGGASGPLNFELRAQ